MTLGRKRIIVFSVVLFCFCVAIFLYLRKQQHNETVVIRGEKKDSIINAILFSEFSDFENNNDASTSTEKAFSGKKSSKLSSNLEYGAGINKPIKDIPSFQNLLNIGVELKCYATKSLTDAIWVLSIDDANGKNIFWGGQPIVCNQKDQWNSVALTYDLKPEYLKPECFLKLYPWNKNKEEFYIDDILINYNGTIAVSNTQTSQLNSNFFYDFENTEGLVGIENIKVTTAHSGKKACDLSSGIEYGPSVVKKVSDVVSTTLKKISTSIWIYSLVDNPNVVLTVSGVNSKNETVFWDGKSSENRHFQKNQWTKINAQFGVPSEKINPDDKLVVNVWNKGKDAVIFDDLEIVYGEPERRGVQSILDPVVIEENGLIPARNKFPFKTLFFQKQEIKNENGTYLNNANSKKIGDLSPNDEFIVGNFLSDKKSMDELICIQATEFGLYGFDPDSSRFQLYLQNKTPDEVSFWKGSKKYVGDYNDKGTDNVLLVNAAKKEIRLLSFSGTSANKITANIIWKTSIFNLDNMIISENDLFVCGDFNGDKKTDLVIVDAKNGNWKMFNFKNNNWETIASGNSGFLTKKMLDTKTSKQLVGKFFVDRNQDVLLVSDFDNGKYSYRSFEYNNKSKRFEEKDIKSENSAEAFFKNSEEVLVGNFDNDTEQEFLKLNTDWRFDLKQIDLDANGFNISYMVDFKGYPKDYNPKYYEFVKIISGNFFNKDQTSLLIMMRNCVDTDFNGKTCKQFENLPFLPNSTQLYNANSKVK